MARVADSALVNKMEAKYDTNIKKLPTPTQLLMLTDAARAHPGRVMAPQPSLPSDVNHGPFK